VNTSNPRPMTAEQRRASGYERQTDDSGCRDSWPDPTAGRSPLVRRPCHPSAGDGPGGHLATLPVAASGAIRATGKVVAVVTALGRFSQLSAIARHFDLKMPTAQRILAELTACGWVERVEPGRYRYGPALYTLTSRAAAYGAYDVEELAAMLRQVRALDPGDAARALLDAGYRRVGPQGRRLPPSPALRATHDAAHSPRPRDGEVTCPAAAIHGDEIASSR